MVMCCYNRNCAFTDCRAEHIAWDHKRGILCSCGYDDRISDEAFTYIQQKAPEDFTLLFVRLWLEQSKYIFRTPDW